jgi:hypothetical protein
LVNLRLSVCRCRADKSAVSASRLVLSILNFEQICLQYNILDMQIYELSVVEGLIRWAQKPIDPLSQPSWDIDIEYVLYDTQSMYCVIHRVCTVWHDTPFSCLSFNDFNSFGLVPISLNFLIIWFLSHAIWLRSASTVSLEARTAGNFGLDVILDCEGCIIDRICLLYNMISAWFACSSSRSNMILEVRSHKLDSMV